MKPYYQDEQVTLYHGNCLEIREWLAADVLLTDPPYGIAYKSGYGESFLPRSIASDESTAARDEALAAWGEKPALVFGTWRAARPSATRQVLVWDTLGALGMGALDLPWKPSHQEVYVLGRGFRGRRTTDVISHPPVQSMASNGRTHPHEKPVGLLNVLLAKCPDGAVADPFCGTGAVLLAAKVFGRRSIGVEIEERYCETAAKRLSQAVLFSPTTPDGPSRRRPRQATLESRTGRRRLTVAALYVATGGCYFGLDGVDPWDEARDARTYAGPWPVVAHPPCARWCSLAHLVESLYPDMRVGEDGGTFAAALAAVRRYGGVLEHPAVSKAWPAHALTRPARGRWERSLHDPGWVTEVSQVAYGHRARKRTWLYYVGDVPPPALDWSEPEHSAWLSWFDDHHSAKVEVMSKRERSATPPAFRDLLLNMARSARRLNPPLPSASLSAR